MAQLTAQNVVITGLNLVMQPIDLDGDVFANTGKEALLVENDGDESLIVVIITQIAIEGIQLPDREVEVAVGETKLIGPFASNVYDDADHDVLVFYENSDGLTAGVTGLDAGVAVIRLP